MSTYNYTSLYPSTQHPYDLPGNSVIHHLEVEFKLSHPDAKLPTYAHPEDAGMDLTATSIDYDTTTGSYLIGTGVHVNLPIGFVGYLFPRSSIYKTDFRLCNSVGVVDRGYDGEIMLRMKSDGLCTSLYKIGDKVAQLIIMPLPKIYAKQVQAFSTSSERGSKGFGSSGS